VLSPLIAFTAPALSDPPAAKDENVAIVPGKAPIIIQLHGYDRAKKRLGAFLSNALPDLAPKLTGKIDAGMKDLLEGRDTKAVSKNGHVFIVINELDGLAENPQWSVVVPVSGFTAFRDSFLTEAERKTVKKEDDGYYSVKTEKLDENLYIADRKTAVVITKEKDLAKLYAGGDYSGLDKALGAGTAKAFLQTDAAVYVSLKEINNKYGAQIKGFKALLPLVLNQAQGVDKNQIEMIKEIFNAFTDLFDDGEAFVLAFEFREEGANLKMQVQFGAKTDTNEVLKEFKPASLSQIGTLPLGQLAYTASNMDFSKSKTLSKIAYSMIADDEDEDAKAKIQAAVKELTEQKTSIQLKASSMLNQGLEVDESADGNKLAAAHLNLLKALTKTSKFGSIPLKDKPTIKENAETVGNVKLNYAKLTFDLEKAVEAAPEQTREAMKAYMTKMMGDGLKMWFGSDGKSYIQVVAKDFSEAKALLQEYLDGKKVLEKDEGYIATRKQLPAEASLVMVGDSCRMIEMGLDLVKDAIAQMGLPGVPALPQLKAPKAKPAYFGAAVTMKSEYVSLDVFVPTTAVQQIRKMFAPVLNDDN
jgi:hypothetical protein